MLGDQDKKVRESQPPQKFRVSVCINIDRETEGKAITYVTSRNLCLCQENGSQLWRGGGVREKLLGNGK